MPPPTLRNWRWPLAAGIAILIAFIALNYRAYDGYFQDDELDNLSWAPSLGTTEFAAALIKPTFDASNFRPPGHLYFTLMGRAFGLDFPPYITPIFAIHLANALLLFLLLRKLGIDTWRALAGIAFFTLSATALDAYWKPMYVFDLLCTMFSLASILLFAYRRIVLSFIAFWLAYKSKELAVMLPAVLAAYEYWFGKRRVLPLLPFLAASLSFGLQGIILNPNKDNDYTFRFTFHALAQTIPFYARRFLFIPFSGLALLPLAAIRDRRVWFGLTALACFIFTLLFLPGRLFEAYAYLPLACATIALAAAASHVKPLWAWIALALWMPLNLRQLHREQKFKLAQDDRVFAYVDQILRWSAKHPDVGTMIYDGAPPGFHDWGVTAAWNMAHRSLGTHAFFYNSPRAAQAIDNDTVAFATWDSRTNTLGFHIHSPK